MGKFKEGYPLLSIVTVSYNEVNTIEQTINSVLGQDYGNFEYIIIDGCSNDGTIEIIESYSDRLSYWVSESDRNLYHGINKGLSQCNGDIIGIIHANDYYRNGVFMNVSKIFMSDDVDAIYSDCLIINNNGINYVNNVRDHTFEENMINHSTFFVAKRVYDKIGFFNIKYSVSADYDFALRIYHDNRFIIKYIEGECFAAHRLGGRESREYWMEHNPFMWLKVLNDYNLIKYKYGHLGIMRYSINLLRGIVVLILIKIGLKNAQNHCKK